MAEIKFGFRDAPNSVSGAALLALYGPTLAVNIGLDADWKPNPVPPKNAIAGINALVDTGAAESCGPFAGADLRAGGQIHLALIGRTFLQHFTMIYEGRTGTIGLSS